ncbi:hypothetical protein JCM17846_05230 [Iodidimonas nitroreducens]|uniref:Uncharacterized protein n=1 Tax=Iodidimonas nitroreducens TaxID=1236968 RepID=A0A5A7N3J0_9PROT|nr:hypothetical protein [Iodidimonas nitroreducens]GER02841.1 hypothetical protein JCM17846_05230 [Iodidimonas nitroreducens]
MTMLIHLLGLAIFAIMGLCALSGLRDAARLFAKRLPMRQGNIHATKPQWHRRADHPAIKGYHQRA